MIYPNFWYKFAKTIFFVAIIFLILASSVDAKSRSSRRTRPAKRQHNSLAVDNSARYSDIVIEARTGRVLHASNADQLRHPASLTKMMTLYITFQALEAGKLRLEQWLPVSANAAGQSPSKLGLKTGKSIRVRDAILGLVTKSANDAAVVLAEAMGGSESKFAQFMTRQARVLGMNQTVFRNPNGLPDAEQVSTARDMAVLGHALVYHYPNFYDYFSQDRFVYSGTVHRNHNRLIERYDGMDGIKTGYVKASGFNLVASAVRNETRIIGVVFGGRSTLSRDNQMAQLLDQGFSSLFTGKGRFSEEAQGDSSDELADANYIALPNKLAAVFPLSARQAEIPSEYQQTSFNSSGFAQKNNQESPINWGIQIGAYNDEASGRQALTIMARNMAQLLSQSDQILQIVRANNGTAIYRSRFMGMEQKTARSICAYLVRRGQGCLVVAPERVKN